MFVGDVFENDPAMRQVKSLLLDYFRGRQVGTMVPRCELLLWDGV